MTERWRLRTIVVPIDFSECSRRALDLARFLSKEAGPAHLVLIHAYFVPAELEALAEEAHEPILDIVSQRAVTHDDKVHIRSMFYHPCSSLNKVKGGFLRRKTCHGAHNGRA